MKKLVTLALITAISASVFASERVLIKFDGKRPTMASALLNTLNGTVDHTIPGIGVTVVNLPEGVRAERAIAIARNWPGVVYAEGEVMYHTTQVVPNDPSFNTQWAWNVINAPRGWAITQGSPNILVAVLDTGIDTDHPDLVGKTVLGRDFTGNTATPAWEDGQGHGTHVSGTVSAITNNGLGVSGTGWNTRLMIGKVLSNSGSGSNTMVANGIIWAADNGARVINMSLGGGSPSTTMENAVNYAASRGVIIVASAGNSNTTSPSYPAFYAACIAVASTTSADARSSFSNFGAWVDVAAPGSNILSTTRGGGYGSLSGTSMAAPHVAGLAALAITRSNTGSRLSVRDRITKRGPILTNGFGSFPIRRIDMVDALR